MSYCRADPAAGPCANVFCPRCRTDRVFAPRIKPGHGGEEVGIFRKLYRAPLSRTDNRTIARHDIARNAAAHGGRRFSGEVARQAQAKSHAAKLITYTPIDWKLQTSKASAASANARRGTKAAAQASSRASKKFWAGKTQEEKNAIAARARRGRYVAPWPFPFRPRSSDPEKALASSMKNLKKARVALNAKRMKRAKKKGDASRRRPRVATSPS